MQNKEVEQRRNKLNMCLFGTKKFADNLEEKYGSAKYRNLEQAKKTCLERYGAENPYAAESIKDKIKQTNLEKYGVENPSQNKDIRVKTEKTCLEKYGVKCYLESIDSKEHIKAANLKKYGVEYTLQRKDIQEKAKNTMLKKYGNRCVFGNKDVREKIKQTLVQKYGIGHPVRKCFDYDNTHFDSSYELAYYIWLTEHNVSFAYQPNLHFEYIYENQTHEYYPDFIVENEIQEIKGLQFFENKNVNEKMINPYDRTLDGLFEAKHQCMLQHNVKIITDCSTYLDYVKEKYTSDFLDLFKTNIEFPYPDNDIIKKYHHSIYSANRNGYKSPIEAWQDKSLVLKSALNRLKYVGSCTPLDIIQGFNVAKIAPKVSVFKRSLAKHLIETYLNDCHEIFDPFSGFSGRMLGACDCNKQYIGQDINETHVQESNNIIRDLHLEATVICKDIFESSGKYESLFTCSPYRLKEIWNENETSLSCDEWIDECIKRFNCKKYLFVVDETEKYKDNIVETIENKSHFNNNNEYVVLIVKQNG